MGLPKQVEEAGKRADELKKKVEGKTEDPKADDKPADGEPDSTTPKKDPEPAPEPPQKKQADEETWEQKFKILQGKYDAEVKNVTTARLNQLQNSIATLNQQVTDLTETNAALAKQNEELLAKAEIKPEPQASVDLSEDELKHLKDLELDDRAIEIIQKMASGGNQGDSSGVLDKVKTQISDLKTQVKKVDESNQASQRKAFISTVMANVASEGEDFAKINDDDGFNRWLDTTVSPSYPGETRRQVMAEADKTMDSVAATTLFKEFIAENKTNAPQEPQNPLEKEVEPNSGSPADPAAAQPQGKSYTPDEISHFYKEMAIGETSGYTKGEWAGKMKECRAMDVDIKKATTEGRIKQ